MMWRVLVLFGVLTLASFVYRTWGESAAWATLAVANSLLLPLSEIERRLAEIVKGMKP